MAIMEEHEPRNDPEDRTQETYQPTPEEKRAIRLVNDLMDKSKAHRSQYDGRWMEFYRFFRGRQWKENRPTYRHKEVINFVFRTIQSLVPIQTDFRPRFEFLPKEPSDTQLAQVLQVVGEHDWETNNWSDQLLEVIYDANIYGTGHSCMTWDGDADRGAGKIVYKSEDPFHMFPDPHSRDVNMESLYFLTAIPTDIKKAKYKYPELGKYLKADMIDLMNGESRTGFQSERMRAPLDSAMLMGNGSSKPLDTLYKDQVLLMSAYIDPAYLLDQFDEYPDTEIDEKTGLTKQIYIQKAKWPNGRYIVTGNGVLLHDGPNPYDDGKFPYQRYNNYILPREYWGVSEVEQIMGPQKVFNKVFSFGLDVMTIMGNPIWMVPTSSGIDPEMLTNRPGLNVEYDGDSPPQRVEGIQLPPYVLNMGETVANWMDSIAGANDITRGVAPPGVTAAKALNFLQETSHTRIRQKSKILDRYLQSVGQQYLARVFQFYTAPRVFRLTNIKGMEQYFQPEQQSGYMKFHVERQPDGVMTAMLQPMTGDGLIDVNRTKQFIMRGDFDVSVITGSALPFAKAERKDEVLNLFDRGIVDNEEVLSRLEYPNKETVLERMKEKAKEAAIANTPKQSV
jgi:hypothetical protein